MARILNTILCTAMAFFLTFAWAVYVLKDSLYATVAAVTVAVCVCLLVYNVLCKWDKHKDKKKNKKRQLADLFAFLQFNDDNATLFSSLLTFYGMTTEKIDYDSLFATGKEKHFVALCFQRENLSADQLQQAVVQAKRNNCKHLILFCNRWERTSQTVAENFIDVKFFDINSTFTLFAQAEKLPSLPHVKGVAVMYLPQIAFSKKRFVWYFFGALFTLLLSAISFFKLYLLLWATALFALAMYSLLNKRYNKLPTEIKLE